MNEALSESSEALSGGKPPAAWKTFSAVAASLALLALFACLAIGAAWAQSLAGPSWQELNSGQRELLQPFASQWNGWTADDKRRWLALADRLPRMEATRQQRARQRISEWAEFTPEQRRIARMNYRVARQLSPDEREAKWERYTTLTPEQQSVLRTSGRTSNTAAGHAGARTGLAPRAAQPLAPLVSPASRASKAVDPGTANAPSPSYGARGVRP